MSLSRRRFLQRSAVAAAGLALPLARPNPARAAATAAGPFQPSWASLSQYQIPEWFRDAKFGMWAHWGPQCVPEQGDWYARRMYQESDHDHQFHREHYGPQSRIGFKDIDHLWKAEDWDPQHLIGLYKAAGAQYFMCLANHHDNLDLFASTHQPWNTVALGPHKDIVGGWERAVRAAGLRFAVSSHASHSWGWYEVTQGADTTGPYAGIPYDGKLTKADGKGLWWEGLDPQDLYAQNHTPGPGGLQWEWDAAKGASVPDAAYCEKFYNRTIELIDKYHPDMIYFDDTVLPLYPISDVGLRIAAHMYNASIKRAGRNEAVITGKILNEQQKKCLVWDIERGYSDKIEPLAWQTDTCIGDWHYSRPLFERHGYKKADQVAHTLVDIVSKNGNLMLNIPLPGGGAPDTDELAFVADLTKWMQVNSPAIYATRPWRVFGEGPSALAVNPLRAQGFNESRGNYTAQDFRFMQKGDALHAFAMAWPDNGTLTITSLGTGTPTGAGRVAQVEMLGAGPLKFTQDANALTVTLPAQRPCDYAYALRITGPGLTGPTV